MNENQDHLGDLRNYQAQRISSPSKWLKEIHYALKDIRSTKVETKEIQLVLKEMVLGGYRAVVSVLFSPVLVITTRRC